jgi:hypothetical protein
MAGNKRVSGSHEWDDEDGESLLTRETEDNETHTPNYEKMGMKPALDDEDKPLECPYCSGKVFRVSQDNKRYTVCEYALRGPDSSCTYNKEQTI